MKTMNLTPTAAAMYENKEVINKFKKTLKKVLAGTIRFLVVISPAYPQYVESQRKKYETC